MASSSRHMVAGFVLLVTLGMCHSRVLHQTADSNGFSTTPNTYIASTTAVPDAASTTASASACLDLCVADASCLYWSWCPATQTSGCTVPGLLDGADTTVPASGCVLSYDDLPDRESYFVMTGSAVPFTGGKYSATRSVPPAAPGTPAVASTDPVSWIDPSGQPAECSGILSGTLSFGNQWAGDEIECHVCDGQYQLKCDLDTDLIGDDSVKCSFDQAGLAALTNNAYEFDCVVDNTKSPVNQCDWEAISGRVPTCAAEPVRRILATWNPRE